MTDKNFKEKQLKEINENYKWYQENRSKIVSENESQLGKYMILKNKDIIGFFNSYTEAILEANKKYKNETYSIQLLEREETVNMMGFFSIL